MLGCWKKRFQSREASKPCGRFFWTIWVQPDHIRSSYTSSVTHMRRRGMIRASLGTKNIRSIIISCWKSLNRKFFVRDTPMSERHFIFFCKLTAPNKLETIKHRQAGKHQPRKQLQRCNRFSTHPAWSLHRRKCFPLRPETPSWTCQSACNINSNSTTTTRSSASPISTRAFLKSMCCESFTVELDGSSTNEFVKVEFQ